MNYVEMYGVVTHLPTERELANGVKTLTWRIKVPRSEVGSDSIPCTINFDDASKGVLKKVLALQVGNSIEIVGELRSRFWQGAQGSASRIEVEVSAIQKIARDLKSAK